MKQRDPSLDIIRLLACFMVVLMHSPMPSENASGPFLVALSYFTAPCIGLFFMVSGALLLPVKTDYFTFLRRRFGKVVIPTVVWSLIYIALRLYHSESEINVLQTVASIPFSAQGEGVLWFMYTLCGLYLLAPILSGWLDRATKREVEFALLLWAVTLCYPLLEMWFTINDSVTGPLYYFGGYAGYFLLGYYLRRYPGTTFSFIGCIISLIGLCLVLVLKKYDMTFDFYRLFGYLSIFIVALASSIFITLQKRRVGHNNRLINSLANTSFGIYLIHILIMRYWLWHQEWIISKSNYPLQCLAIALITLLLSTAICTFIAYIPGAEWLIGYRIKRTGDS